MGGYGALKLGMLFPEVFCCVYALSPGALALVKEFGPNSDSYKQLAAITTKEELDKTYFPKVIVDMARTWSPNPGKPPFYCDVPFRYVGEELIVDHTVLKKWNQNLPLSMIDDYVDNLKELKAIKLDWGRNDASRFPLQCSMFSQKLENLGIEHFAEEYIGTHTNRIWTEDGRVLNSMLPFFNIYLQYTHVPPEQPSEPSGPGPACRTVATGSSHRFGSTVNVCKNLGSCLNRCIAERERRGERSWISAAVAAKMSPSCFLAS
jgi:hypothetical protein